MNSSNIPRCCSKDANVARKQLRDAQNRLLTGDVPDEHGTPSAAYGVERSREPVAPDGVHKKVDPSVLPDRGPHQPGEVLRTQAAHPLRHLGPLSELALRTLPAAH